MKVRRISCTQFAGLTEKSVTLKDGINILCGKNESGKSTLVHLLGRTLFQNARLDKRSDRAFRQLYFPAPLADSAAVGDFIDGSVTLETDAGLYTLKKEWGENPQCTLTTPTGILRSTTPIEETMRSVLGYGEGVYGEILLSSQADTAPALSALLDPNGKSEARPEITAAVTAAFAETGALSIDAIGQAIEEKIDTIAGKHWDFESGMPQRKTGGGRWASGLGEILKAYYEWEDARFAQTEVHRLERERDSARQTWQETDQRLTEAEEACNSFAGYAGTLSLCRERRENAAALEKETARLLGILHSWPQTETEYQRALALRDEQQARTLLDTCAAVRKLREEAVQLRAELSDLSAPSPEEIQTAKQNERRARLLENSLCGMNLSAVLRTVNGHTAEIRSLRTGELLTVSDGHAALTEAVRISVPGVLEMILSPSDVDADEVQRELTALRETTAAILQKHHAERADELEEILRRRNDLKRELTLKEDRIALVLGDREETELQKQADAIAQMPRSPEEIQTDIRALTPDGNIAAFLTVRETILAGYRREHVSPENLHQKYAGQQNKLEQLRALLAEEEDIPEKYRRVDNPEWYLNTLRQSADNLRTAREEALRRKTETETRLDALYLSLSEDPAEKAERTDEAFRQTKELLSHWMHIRAVFEDQKQRISDSPLQGLADRFLSYLRLLSDGRVCSEFPEKDALQMRILSGDRLVNYDQLSEGTKQTVSLAFRLAVLDQLFPAGGGVIVLDDPLTDMDAERTEQACRLIRECARRHQVLFLTCREEYIPLLEGTVLYMSEI